MWQQAESTVVSPFSHALSGDVHDPNLIRAQVAQRQKGSIAMVSAALTYSQV